MPHGLAERLRHETADLHRLAERSGPMPAMLDGRVDCAVYILLLRSLHPVYLALEHGLARHAHEPALAPFADPALARAPALARDLAALHGPDWAGEVPLLPAGAAYAERVTASGAARPPLLAAHAYVRYLGDLSGGRMLGRTIARGLRLAGDDGLAFYRFPEVGDIGACKRHLRAALDALPLTPPEADAFVQEAREAFAANVRIFESLTPPASPRIAPSDA